MQIERTNFWQVTLNITTVGASIATIAGVILAIILSIKAATVKTLEEDKMKLEGIIRNNQRQIDSLTHLLENQKSDSLDKK